MATIRNATIAAWKSPNDAAMLFVVAAASAGTMRVFRTPNWANDARSAISSRLNAVASATRGWALPPARRLTLIDDSMVMWSLPEWLSLDVSGWDRRLAGSRWDRRSVSADHQRSQHRPSARCLLGDRGEGLHGSWG